MTRSPRSIALGSTLALALLSFSPGLLASPQPETHVRVIVQADAASSAADAVVRAGGTVTRTLGVINAVSARVPSSAVGSLARADGVRAVTPDSRLTAQSDSYDAKDDPTSTLNVVEEVTGASEYWKRGIKGNGVDVALIDSGITPVAGLNNPARLRFGPDLSFESQQPSLMHLDTYGHGTHMAGIIAGSQEDKSFSGVAPGARLVSLKVADATGAADVSQVIAAIDWVVQNRNRNGLNIKVLNLAFSTDGTQSYLVDPLAHAAEVAWRRGVVVVVAAGNMGQSRVGLGNPAMDPYVIAVAAGLDADGQHGFDDVSVMPWSARGNGVRNPDLVASGRSIASLRVPGSYIDLANPGARVGDRFFRGSGTSQAAAVVSGAAALLLAQRPDATPDQVKSILTGSAAPIAGATPVEAGAGMVNLRQAYGAPTPAVSQSHPTSQGTGSLDQARGSMRASSNGVELAGEQDIFGHAWDGASWSGASWSGASWSGGEWMGATWTGASWSGASWSGASWSGASWSGASWSGASWSGASWSGASWSGASWSGASWSGASWSGASWSGASWSGASWSTATWE